MTTRELLDQGHARADRQVGTPVSGPAAAGPRRALEELTGVPFTEGNQVDVLRNGDQAFPAMFEAIGSATRTIDVLWFLWGKGPVTGQLVQALAGRARAGVRVRVLLDGVGAMGMERAQVRLLRQAGVRVVFYRPASTWRITAVNLRTHRRALVCDEKVAFTGGAGIDRAWTGDGSQPSDWRDTHFRVRGPAVAGVRAAFAMAWLQTPYPLLTHHDMFPEHPRAGTAAVQVLRPASQPGWNEATAALVALLGTARQSVRIATPYARLPGRLLDLLTATARRGVTVQLLVPGAHVVDHPAVRLQGERNFRPLLESGVEIWEYQPSMLHTKVLLVDRTVAMVGTVNLDVRSLSLNEQVCLVVEDRGVAAVLHEHYSDDLSASRRTTLGAWRDRPVRRRLLEVAADTVARPLRGPTSAGLTGRRP